MTKFYISDDSAAMTHGLNYESIVKGCTTDFEKLRKIYDAILILAIDRHSTIIISGGKEVQNICLFAARTIMRGIATEHNYINCTHIDRGIVHIGSGYISL